MIRPCYVVVDDEDEDDTRPALSGPLFSLPSSWRLRRVAGTTYGILRRNFLWPDIHTGKRSSAAATPGGPSPAAPSVFSGYRVFRFWPAPGGGFSLATTRRDDVEADGFSANRLCPGFREASSARILPMSGVSVES